MCAAMHALHAALEDLARDPRPRLTIDVGAALDGVALDRLARVHAARVLALGCRPGDRVAVNAPPSLELVAAIVAHLRLGLVHVPLNHRYTAPEIAHVIGDAGAREVAPTRAHEAEPIAAWPAAPRADAPALIVYTSGTTGKPKGVTMSARGLGDNLGAMMGLWGIGAGDVVAHALPLFHVHGLGLGLLGPLATGAHVRLFAKFDAGTLCAACADARAAPTVIMTVPTMVHALVQHLEAHGDDAAQLARVRLVTAGSAALPATLLERFRALTGHTILERYGMTETLFTLSNPLAGERRPGTVGLPVPGVEVRLAGDDGAAMALEVRGAGMMLGYWGRPDATREAFTADGWFKTGDLATRDADGYVRIVGRASTDLIKSGGFKIGAREIEDVVLAHPSVRECAVVGVPDERWGEIVAAAIVGEPGDAEALAAFCAERLADFKRPRRVMFVDALPKNAMGKVVKVDVRALFWP